MAGELWQALTQIGKETTAGTAVAATRRIYAEAEFTREREPNMTKVNTGTRDNQRDIKLRAVKATATLKMPLGADEIIELFLASIQGAVTPTIALGESDWQFRPGAALDPQTLEYFDGYWPWQMRGCLLDTLKLSGSVSGDANVEATYFGREMIISPLSGTGGAAEVQTLTSTATGGSGVLTFMGQSTAAIAFNATAGTIQTALQGLVSIGAGNVTCTGGPLNTTPVVCTFAAALTKVPNLPLITVGAGFTGGTVVPSRTTPGALVTPLADRVPNFIQGWELKLYLDAFGATPGTTVVPATIIDWEVEIRNNLARKYFGDNTQATGNIVIGELGVTTKMTLEAHALAMAEYVHWESADKRIARLELGNNVPVIGTSAKKPLVSLDIPGAWTAVDRAAVDNNTRVYQFTEDYIYDPTNSFGFQAKVQSSRAAAY